MNHDIKDAENAEKVGGGTIQFSLKKPKGTPAKRIQPIGEEPAEDSEEELLKNQAVPTEFEDVFSDSEKENEDTAAADGVVAIEEVFKQKSNMINEDFHNETGENFEEKSHSKLRKAAIAVGIISAAVILAVAAVAVIVLL